MTETTDTKATETSKPAAPSDREIKRMVAQILVDAGAEWFSKLPKKGTTVKIGEEYFDRATVLASCKQVFGYIPAATTWPKQFGARDAGRKTG